MFFEVIILILLVLGTYLDIKSRFVPDRITHAIAILSIPILNLSNTYTINGIVINDTLKAQVYFVYLILAIYYIGKNYHYPPLNMPFNMSADAKVIIPLVFTMNIMQFFIFLMIMQIVGILLFLIKPKQSSQAGFIPILIGYTFTMILPLFLGV